MVNLKSQNKYITEFTKGLDINYFYRFIVVIKFNREEILMTKIIAVVGKSGCGKTTFCEEFSKRLNCQTINIDKVGHAIYDVPEFIQFISDNLGEEYINSQGKIIDRKMVGEYIFSHLGTHVVDEFNELTWRLMQDNIDEQLRSAGEYIILDWFNLPNTKYFAMADMRILVQSKDNEQRMMMIRLRDNISREYLEKRENAGVEYDEADFDCVFVNDYNEQTMLSGVEKIAKKVEELV